MRLLTDDEFAVALANFERTAFRLEQQRQYVEAVEQPLFRRWLDGDLTPPTDVPAVREWLGQIRRQTAAGKRIERVRVQDEPPTDYQAFERWFGQWNTEAGEHLRYMTRSRAQQGDLRALSPSGDDWWLLDSARLLVMRFDADGNRDHIELITDPEWVDQACKWRDLAVHHSTSEADRGAVV